jgi:hypothetical protein
MLEATQLAAISGGDDTKTATLHTPEIAVRKKEEFLPFTIAVVREEAQLEKAVHIRHSAYGRHVPALAATLSVAEPHDRDSGSILLLAESKLDGSSVGTMRIQTNRDKPLALEASAQLPNKFSGKRLAEATRLGVAQGSTGRVVKTALFKAFYLVCVEADIDWMVIAGRPPLDRQYQSLLFEDVYPGMLVDLKHAANIPHRILALNVKQAEATWRGARHPLFDFMVRTHHGDIDVSGANSTLNSAPVDQSHPSRIMRG